MTQLYIFCRHFSIIVFFFYRILDIVPVLFLVLIYFIYSSMYMLTPNPNLSLPSLAPLVTLSLFSMYVSLYLFCEKSILFFFLDSTKKWHHMIFIFFCLTYLTLGPSVLLQMALFYSFYGQIIFHYVCVCVYTHHTFFLH